MADTNLELPGIALVQDGGLLCVYLVDLVNDAMNDISEYVKHQRMIVLKRLGSRTDLVTDRRFFALRLLL